MTIASLVSSLGSSLGRHRRLLLLCAATLALHYAAIDWAGTRLGAQQRRAPPAPATITAQLMMAEATPATPVAPVTTAAAEPVPQPPPPKPQSRPPPRPRPAPAAPVDEPVDEPVADAAPATVSDAAVPVPDTAPAAGAAPPADSGAPGFAPAGAAQAGTAQPQAAAPPPAAEPAVAATAAAQPQPPVPAARRYKVNLPPSAEFDMDVARVDANGTKWTGVASMTWHTDGSRYTAMADAGLSMLITRLNLLTQTSEGTIDDYGIAPVTATEKIRGRALTATHFNRDAGTITFSATALSYPLGAGAQDRTTLLFQLGGIGRADVNQFGGDIDILVGEAKEANVFRFQLAGQEELDTRMGKLVTWHLVRPPRPGSYSSKLEVWLAPGLDWYPVQFRNTEASGALTTQTVSHITHKEK